MQHAQTVCGPSKVRRTLAAATKIDGAIMGINCAVAAFASQRSLRPATAIDPPPVRACINLDSV